MISAQCRCWVIRVFYVFPFLFVAMEKYQFEVCANSVESCMEAQAGGADRVELCAGIPEGGTTPSYGEMFIARRVLDSVALHVIIRPRGGDFLYSPVEIETMEEDIRMARQAGADGVVFGCLTPEGELDMPAMERLMKAAEGKLRRAVYLNFGVLLSAVLVHYLCPVLLPWSLDCALYAVSFLLFGKALSEKEIVERLYRKPGAVLLLAAVFAVLSWLNGSVNMSVADYGRSMILYLIVGCAGSLLVMVLSLFLEKHMGLLGKSFGFLGRHTLPVLCLHLFVYSLIGTALRLLGL